MTKSVIETKFIKKLLIRSTNWIGDAVMTTPAIRAIRTNFPSAEISVLAKPLVAPVFDNNPAIDNVIIYDQNGRHKGIFGIFRLAKDLKKYEFDAAILLQNAIEAAIITWLAKIPCRIGYNTDGRRLLLTHPVTLSKQIKKVHQTNYYLEILKGIGLETGTTDLEIFVSSENNNNAINFLKSYEIDPNSTNQSIVGIAPGATYGPAKQWFSNHYAELANKICEKFNSRIIIFGGPNDTKTADEITQAMKYQAINLAGKTSLAQAIALIKQCNLFITNDSGLMHIGAALNIPLIAIFGSTNPITTGPHSKNSQIVRVPIACSPCLKPTCPKGHLMCMKNITVDMVFGCIK